jgi:hypothetical protein
MEISIGRDFHFASEGKVAYESEDEIPDRQKGRFSWN